MAGRPPHIAATSIADLNRTNLFHRAEQVANIISGGHQNHNITEEQLENFFDQVKFQLGFRSHQRDSTHGKVYTAQNKIPTELKLTPLQDLMICNNRLTWRGRESLKSALLKQGKDVFAPTRQVEEQLQYFSSFGKIEQFNYEEGKTSYYLSNIHEYLQIRLKNIWKNGLFLTLRDKIVLCVSGDKGGKYTKICLQIGNTVNPNSSGSIILLAMYDNSDTHDILASSCQ
ncbi:hypothetical protein DdX_20478 [Ditylenchus destructor]|uniref:Uncharacterized protein n=1 Tax=Ditylenchus destructor TaxID=166010 RepID=A0AAD4QW53_9BILA|nr:hypothetical protein DdX_20478 [Ditylenchus destructor]